MKREFIQTKSSSVVGQTIELVSTAKFVGNYIKADGIGVNPDLWPELNKSMGDASNLYTNLTSAASSNLNALTYVNLRSAAKLGDRTFYTTNGNQLWSVGTTVNDWKLHDNNCPSIIDEIATLNNNMYAISYASGLYTSVDGINFNYVDQNYFNSIEFIASTGTRLFVFALDNVDNSANFYYSVDGNNWTKFNNFPAGWVYHPDNLRFEETAMIATNVLSGGNYQIFASYDSGLSWMQVSPKNFVYGASTLPCRSFSTDRDQVSNTVRNPYWSMQMRNVVKTVGLQVFRGVDGFFYTSSDNWKTVIQINPGSTNLASFGFSAALSQAGDLLVSYIQWTGATMVSTTAVAVTAANATITTAYGAATPLAVGFPMGTAGTGTSIKQIYGKVDPNTYDITNLCTTYSGGLPVYGNASYVGYSCSQDYFRSFIVNVQTAYISIGNTKYVVAQVPNTSNSFTADKIGLSFVRPGAGECAMMPNGDEIYITSMYGDNGIASVAGQNGSSTTVGAATTTAVYGIYTTHLLVDGSLYNPVKLNPKPSMVIGTSNGSDITSVNQSNVTTARVVGSAEVKGMKYLYVSADNLSTKIFVVDVGTNMNNCFGGSSTYPVMTEISAYTCSRVKTQTKYRTGDAYTKMQLQQVSPTAVILRNKNTILISTDGKNFLEDVRLGTAVPLANVFKDSTGKIWLANRVGTYGANVWWSLDGVKWNFYGTTSHTTYNNATSGTGGNIGFGSWLIVAQDKVVLQHNNVKFIGPRVNQGSLMLRDDATYMIGTRATDSSSTSTCSPNPNGQTSVNASFGIELQDGRVVMYDGYNQLILQRPNLDQYVGIPIYIIKAVANSYCGFTTINPRNELVFCNGLSFITCENQLTDNQDIMQIPYIPASTGNRNVYIKAR